MDWVALRAELEGWFSDLGDRQYVEQKLKTVKQQTSEGVEALTKRINVMARITERVRKQFYG